MVDFNNDSTIGTAAVDIERVSILQRRYDFIEAFEDYKKKRLAGAGVGLFVVRARLMSLFFELQATLKRRLDQTEYDSILNTVMNGNKEDQIIETFYKINEELDKMKLIKIDTKNVFDFKIAEEDNKSMGL